MAEKMSTLVLKVDFDCSKCHNKVRRALCQYHYEIRSQTIDKKHGTITITGPFDAQTLSKNLNKMAGKAIKSIEIKKEEEKPKAKPADSKQETKPKQADAKDNKPAEGKAAEKPKTVTIAEPAKEGKADAAKAAAPAPAPAPAPAVKLVGPGPVLAYPVVQYPYGEYPVPCYEGYVGGGPGYDGYGRPLHHYEGYGGNRGYGNNGYIHGSEYFSERDPSCIIM